MNMNQDKFSKLQLPAANSKI